MKPYISKLVLNLFRSYEGACFEFGNGVVAFYGENGAGKTNILEALSLFSAGRGLRNARLQEMQYGAEKGVGKDVIAPKIGWSIAADLEGHIGGVLKLGTGYDVNAAMKSRHRRIIRADGETIKNQISLGDYSRMVWLTPDMDRLFSGSSPLRRRFLDRMVFSFDAHHAARVSAFERLLRERAKILRDAKLSGKHLDMVWIKALESQMAERAVAIAAARNDLIRRLNIVANGALSLFPAVDVSLEGWVEDFLKDHTALETEIAYADRLSNMRHRGVDGPHKTDLKAMHLGTGDWATRCSTGEKKAITLRLVLAHAQLLKAETAKAPILLLDEVAAHLDKKRRVSLYEEIIALEAQSFLTGTDIGLFEALRGEGQIIEVGGS